MFQIQGINSGVTPEVEGTHALRLVSRPMDWGALGSFSFGSVSGTMAAGLAAASPIFSLRYGAANLALIRRILFTMANAGTGFATGICSFTLFTARSFTVSDTGGTSVTPAATPDLALRSTMAASGVTNIRTSTTATLTAGTRTLDAKPIARIDTIVPATASIIIVPADTPLLDERAGEYPLVLAQNEGFVIQATVPATGTWGFSVTVVWDELAAF